MISFLPQAILPFLFFLILLIFVIYEGLKNVSDKGAPVPPDRAEKKKPVLPFPEQPKKEPEVLEIAAETIPVEEETAQPEPAAATTEESSPEPTLHSIATKADDENLKGLLLDRLEEMEELEDEPEQQALCLVNLIDELHTVHNAFSGNDSACIELMLIKIQKHLQENGCELLDTDTWDPTIQRAIKIDYVLPEGQGPIIITKGATGLKVRGRLIRKQEVHIQKSKQA